MNKFIFMFFISMLCFNSLHGQQPENKFSAKAESTKVAIEKEYQFLKEEIRDFRAYIAQERQEHREFLENTFSNLAWFISVVAAIVGGIIIFFDFRTKKEIKDSVQRRFREFTRGLIDEENQQINISISDLRKIINRETNYLNKKIVFWGSDSDKSKFENRELELITTRGIKSIIFAENQNDLNKLIKDEKIDLIIYYYNPTAEKNDPILHQLVAFLNENKKRIPLLVYNYEKEGEAGRLFSSDWKTVQTYPYQIVPNSPITLVNHLYTTINYFSG